jgi:type IV pilus assembly protein PilP
MSKKRLGRLSLIATCALLASACNPQIQELEAWMEDVRINTQPVRTQIEEPKRFEPFRYTKIEAVAPFSAMKLAALQDPMQVRAKGGIAPDVNRRRELLESFPVEQIQMVGFLRSTKANAALLQVDKTVHTARVGNYAGLNYGVITRINETEIALKEIVQDATGDWVERQTTIKLQEATR